MFQVNLDAGRLTGGDIGNLLAQHETKHHRHILTKPTHLWRDIVTHDKGGGTGGAGAHLDTARDRQDAQCLDKQQPQIRLHVESSILGPQPTKKGAPTAGIADIMRQLFQEFAAPHRAPRHRLLKLAGKPRVAMHHPKIKEDVDIHQITGRGAPHPVADRLPPAGKGPAPGGVARHHIAAAIGNAGSIQNIGDMAAKLHEPGAVGIVIFGVSKQDGMVLVGRQQTFAARRRAKHQHRIFNRRTTPSCIAHHHLGKPHRLAQRGPVLATDDGRDVQPRHAFAGQ